MVSGVCSSAPGRSVNLNQVSGMSKTGVQCQSQDQGWPRIFYNLVGISPPNVYVDASVLFASLFIPLRPKILSVFSSTFSLPSSIMPGTGNAHFEWMRVQALIKSWPVLALCRASRRGEPREFSLREERQMLPKQPGFHCPSQLSKLRLVGAGGDETGWWWGWAGVKAEGLLQRDLFPQQTKSPQKSTFPPLPHTEQDDPVAVKASASGRQLPQALSHCCDGRVRQWKKGGNSSIISSLFPSKCKSNACAEWDLWQQETQLCGCLCYQIKLWVCLQAGLRRASMGLTQGGVLTPPTPPVFWLKGLCDFFNTLFSISCGFIANT